MENFEIHEVKIFVTVPIGGDQASSVPIPGHCLLHLGPDGIKVSRHTGAADRGANPAFVAHHAACNTNTRYE
jgi:hypothetical protein